MMKYAKFLNTEKIELFQNPLTENGMDGIARERHYDGIMSACSYATSLNPTFSREGLACLIWRDAVWEKCHEFLVTLEQGEMTIPSEEDFLASLPVFVWPDEVKPGQAQ